MANQILHEIIPLTENDCYTIFSRHKNDFDFPLHSHEEYELNFIMHGKGVKRYIGDHISEIGEIELVLVGPYLPHCWLGKVSGKNQIFEITIQFHKHFLDDNLLKRNQLIFIRKMLEKSVRGILFSEETTLALKDRLIRLVKLHGFDGVLELLSILHDMSISRNMLLLSDSGFIKDDSLSYNSRRIGKVMDFINNGFDKQINLKEVAGKVNMSEAAFSRFFKKRTGKNFIDSLTEIRIGHASRMLIDTTHTISEIAYLCGFNNISNFNRIFKKKKVCTPKEFRESYNSTTGRRMFV